MSSVYVCNRFVQKPGRRLLDNVNISGNVLDLRLRIANELGINNSETELVYCGEELCDGRSLESYGIKPRVTIHVLKKTSATLVSEDKLDRALASQVISAFRAAITNPAFRSAAEGVLQDRNTIEKLLVSVPQLRHDPMAVALLESAPLLLTLAMNVDSLRRVVETQPVFGQAAMILASLVNEAGRAQLGGGMLGAEGGQEEEAGGGQSGAWHSSITSDQLAAALASAQPPRASASSLSQLPAGQAAGLITGDFFRQAMQSVAPASTSSSSLQLQEQLRQLRDMGIMDETVARRALEATGGNVQEALELIFGAMDD